MSIKEMSIEEMSCEEMSIEEMSIEEMSSEEMCEQTNSISISSSLHCSQLQPCPGCVQLCRSEVN